MKMRFQRLGRFGFCISEYLRQDGFRKRRDTVAYISRYWWGFNLWRYKPDYSMGQDWRLHLGFIEINHLRAFCVSAGLMLALLFVVACNVITPTPPTPAPASGCDESLWDHVYHPARLEIVSRCFTVTATFVQCKDEADGDRHCLFDVDPAFKYLIVVVNEINKGYLVVEPICQRPPTQADAIDSCIGFQQPFVEPAPGQHVSITGALVHDLDHGGHTEIHPFTRIVAN